MATNQASKATTAVAALFLVVLGVSMPAFLVSRGGHPSAANPPAISGLRGSAEGYNAPSAATTAAMATAFAAAAIGAAALVRPTSLRREPSVKVQSTMRRELAVAYEDSGIELLDNGKFCQGLVGGDGAWGEYNFDPAGFSKYTELVPYLREAEVKHGRIAQLAWLGLVIPDFVRVPGERYSFEAIPVTIDAHDALNGAIGVNFQVLFWVGIVEFCCAKKVFEWNSLECAGDYNLGIPFLPKDQEGQNRMRLAELKNGRLAMVAFSGAITQAAVTRHPFPWLF